MTTHTTKNEKRSALVSLATIAAIVAGTAGLYFAPTFAKALTEQSELGSGAAENLATISASRKTQCIMPPALRRGCGA